MRTLGLGERPRLQPHERNFVATVAGINVGKVYQKGDGWHGITPGGEHGPHFADRDAAADWLAEQELGR